MIAPSICVALNTVDMNIAGVEASPQSTVTQPAAVSASKTAFFSTGAEMRASWPTAMRRSRLLSPVRCARNSTNPLAMRFAASAVRFTGSSATPSTAIPRTSLPFASFSKAFSVIITMPPVNFVSSAMYSMESGRFPFFPAKKYQSILPLPRGASRIPCPPGRSSLTRLQKNLPARHQSPAGQAHRHTACLRFQSAWDNFAMTMRRTDSSSRPSLISPASTASLMPI